MRVLIVDDDSQNIELLKAALMPIGIKEILAAHNGADAIELAQSQQPDIILMDLLLRAPIPFGWDAIQALKDDPTTQHIPVIAVTAGGPQAIQRAMKAGCDAYLERPFQLPKLRQTVQQFLSTAN